MTDEVTNDTELTPEESRPDMVQHRIAIPNEEFIDVVEAAVLIGLNSGRISKSITLFEGEAYQTVDVEFEVSSDEENILSYLYAFATHFPNAKVMIADGELWENTRAMMASH